MSSPLAHSIKTAHKNKAARHNAPLVLHICTDLGHDDPGREVVDLALQLQRRSWRNLIASSGGTLALDAERAAIRLSRMPLHQAGVLAQWQCTRRMGRLIKQERPALLHIHIANADEANRIGMALHLMQRWNTPVLLDIRNPLPLLPRIKKHLSALTTAGAMIRVPSEYMGYHLHRDFGIPAENIYYAPSGIDLGWFNNTNISAERLQKLNSEWRLPEQGHILLAPMPLTPESNHEALLTYLAQRRDQPIFTILLGQERPNTGMRRAIEQRVLALGLGGKVVMPETCPDWPAALWLSHLVVSLGPQPRGEHRLLLAAQAMGRPVIVSDCGANRELLPPNSDRQIVAVGDQAALTAALDHGIHHLGHTMATQAGPMQDFIANRYPHDEWVTDMLTCYDRLTRSPRKPYAERAIA